MCAGGTKFQAARYVGVSVGLAILHTLIAVRVSYAQKHFSTALAEKNKGEPGTHLDAAVCHCQGVHCIDCWLFLSCHSTNLISAQGPPHSSVRLSRQQATDNTAGL